MNYRKLKPYMILLLVISILTGCTAYADTGGEVQTQTYAWPLGTASPDNTVTNLFAQKFADEVYRLSDGRMRIQVYPNSTVGGDRELLEMCEDGDIPFVMQNTAPQVSFMPEMAIFDLPCAFATIEEIRDALDNPVFFDQIHQVYSDAGYEILGYADQSFRVLSANREVTSLEDMKGLKIRTMENFKHIAFWKGLNANPTPMSFSEVYIALQQGTVDAQENSYVVMVSSKLYEQQDYVIQTNHVPDLISCIVSKKFFEKLSEEDQAIIREAADIAIVYARALSDEQVGERLAIIEESGTVVLPVSDEFRAEILENSKPLYESVKEEVGEGIYNAYLGIY